MSGIFHSRLIMKMSVMDECVEGLSERLLHRAVCFDYYFEFGIVLKTSNTIFGGFDREPRM